MLKKDLARDLGEPITLEEYRRHPVWVASETEIGEELMCPLQLTGEKIDNLAFDSAFVLADLELNDGARLEGEIFVNLYREQIYGLSLFRNGEVFRFHWALGTARESLERLSEWLGKPFEAITPIKYSTPYLYGSGARISGSLDLHKW